MYKRQAVLLLYYNPICKGRGFRNGFLFFASVVFYAWGEPVYVILMLVSIFMNWLLGLSLRRARWVTGKMVLAVVLNLSMLFLFKYYDFAVTNVNGFLGLTLPVLGLELPIGISFYTFQALSYVIDVKRKPELAQENPLYVGLYIACFPQLIAGPIVRYETVAEQIRARRESWPVFCQGLRLSLIHI